MTTPNSLHCPNMGGGICRVRMLIPEILCTCHIHILRKCLTTAQTLWSKKATCLGENEAQLEKTGSWSVLSQR